MFIGARSFQEIDAYVEALPPESAVKTALLATYSDDELVQMSATNDNPSHGAWSRTDGLIANLIDAVNHLTYVQISSKSEKPVDPPEPTPRPGVARKAAIKANPQQVAYLEAIREKARAEKARVAEQQQTDTTEGD